MSSVALLSGVAIGLFGAGLVFVDAVRRELPVRTRALWTAGVGVVSVGSSVVLYVFNNALFQLYFRMTQRPVVVQSPRELLVVFIAISLAVSAGAVLTYGLGSRFGPFNTA